MLSRYVDAIVLRTFEQERLEVLAEAATVPVVNSFSDFEHPCQALADLLTVRERHRWRRTVTTLTYLGDGNNVAHSLLLAGAKTGHARADRHPAGVRADPAGRAPGRGDRRRDGRERRGASTTPRRPPPTGRRALHRRVGQHGPGGRGRRAHSWCSRPTNWTSKLVDLANDDVVVLHCLPAHRGQEIAADVMDGPHAAVWDEAENRLHTQKALLLRLFGLA